MRRSDRPRTSPARPGVPFAAGRKPPSSWSERTYSIVWRRSVASSAWTAVQVSRTRIKPMRLMSNASIFVGASFPACSRRASSRQEQTAGGIAIYGWTRGLEDSSPASGHVQLPNLACRGPSARRYHERTATSSTRNPDAIGVGFVDPLPATRSSSETTRRRLATSPAGMRPGSLRGGPADSRRRLSPLAIVRRAS